MHSVEVEERDHGGMSSARCTVWLCTTRAAALAKAYAEAVQIGGRYGQDVVRNDTGEYSLGSAYGDNTHSAKVRVFEVPDVGDEPLCLFDFEYDDQDY